MIKGSGNIFFDISNIDFTITSESTDIEAPSIPANLTITSVTQNSVQLSWDSSTDNEGVTGYDIYNDDHCRPKVLTDDKYSLVKSYE